MSWLVERWRGLPRWRKGAWGAVLVCLLLAAGTRPFVRWADPELAVVTTTPELPPVTTRLRLTPGDVVLAA